MRTQETFSLLQSADEIQVAIDSDGDRIGGLLNEQSPLPVGEGEAAFDYRKHFRSLGLQLQSAKDQAVAAEDEHAARLIRVARRKFERDEAVRENYGKLVRARQGLDSVYPDGGFELASVQGETPQAPKRLLDQIGRTVKLLNQPAVDLRAVRSEGFSVDLPAVAANLESGLPELAGSIARYARSRKKAEGSLVAKKEAVQGLRRIVLWVGRTTEGLFHLAGEDELAERIRTSTRRSPRRSQPPSEETLPEESTSAPAAGPEGAASEEPASEGAPTQPTSEESPAS